MSKQKKQILALIIVAVVTAIAAGVVAFIVLTRGGSSIEKMLNAGDKYLEEKDYEQAIAKYEAALEIDENCVEAYLGIAKAYEKMKDYDNARATYIMAIEHFEDEGDEKAVKKIEKKFEKFVEKYGDGGSSEPVTTDSAATDTTEVEVPVATAPITSEEILEGHKAELEENRFQSGLNIVDEYPCKIVRESADYGYYTEFSLSESESTLNTIYYDVDLDGEDELVVASIRGETTSISAYDVENGKEKCILNVALPDGLCSTTQSSYGKLNLATKNGKVYIIWETDASVYLFADGDNFYTRVYEVNGNSANIVAQYGSIGSDFSYIYEGYDEECNEFTRKLNDLGFTNSAARYNEYMRIEESDGLTPVVCVMAKHNSVYDPDYDFSALWNDAEHADAGYMLVVASTNLDFARNVIESVFR